MKQGGVRFVADFFQLANFIQVKTCGEVTFTAGEYNHMHIRACTQFIEHAGDFFQYVGCQGIAFVGPVDGDSGYPFRHFQIQILKTHCSYFHALLVTLTT